MGVESRRRWLVAALIAGICFFCANPFITGQANAHGNLPEDRGPFAEGVSDRVNTQHLEPLIATDGSVTLAVELGESTFELSLYPHSMRAHDFEWYREDAAGELILVPVPPPPSTYRGSVSGISGSFVSASIYRGRLSAFVSPGDGSHWKIEPLDRFEPGAADSEYVAWLTSVPTITTSSLTSAASIDAQGAIGAAAANGSGLCEDVISYTEIAFDSDDNFCRTYGDDSAAAMTAIETNMSDVDSIFRRDISIAWVITRIVTRCHSGAVAQAPYSQNNDGALLCAFRDQWHNNMSGVQRDIAHLKTDKSLGGIGGVAEPNSICGRRPRGNCIQTTEISCTTDGDCPDPSRQACTGTCTGGGGCCNVNASYFCGDSYPSCPTGAECKQIDDCGDDTQDLGYSLSVGVAIGPLAHELAHNYGAGHCNPANETDCDIMKTSAGSTSFSQLVTTQMQNFRATLSCLDYREYVDLAATGTDDGSSWDDAHTDLQDALTDTDTCSEAVEIWVAAGSYEPTSGSSRDIAFELRSGVAIYGGFAGDETTRDDRDPEMNRTVLSGDLLGDDTASFNNNGENSYHVVVASGTDATAELHDVVITAGHADGAGTYENRGAGIFNDGGSPTIVGCTVAYNQASLWGGGMDNLNGASPTLRDSVFVHNDAGNGGALSIRTTSSPMISRTLIVRNEAMSGGGVYSQNSTPSFASVIFAGNDATSGSSNGGGAVANVFASQALFVDSAFVGNRAADRGGAIMNSGSDPQVLDSTLVNNHSAGLDAGGIKNEGGGNPMVRNGIVWGNTSLSGGESAQFATDSGSPAIDYTCLQYWSGGLGGSGNTGGDPKFIGSSVGQWSGTPTYDTSTFQSTFTDSTRSWSTDVHVGKFLNPDTTQELYSVVTANTATTITVWGTFGAIGFPGDPYELSVFRLRSGSSAENTGANIYLPADDFDLDDDGNTSESLPLDLDDELRVQAGTVDMGAYEGAFAPELVSDVDFSGGEDDWGTTTQSGGGSPPPTITIENIAPMDDALHVFRPPFPDESSAWVTQPLGVPIAPVDELTLSFDVWVADQNFDQYDFDNVYPANVWLAYEDDLGMPQTFRRSFYIAVAPGHTPDPEPLAEMLIPATWTHREFDLGNLIPPIANLVEIRVGSEGWSYDVAFDNVSLLREVPGPDCNANGTADPIEINQGTAPDCNDNGIPDECDIAAMASEDCDTNGVPDECDPDTDSDGVPDACDVCVAFADPGQEDCDMDGVGDICAIASGADPDANGNGIPDSCDPRVIPTSSGWSRLLTMMMLLTLGAVAMRRARQGR